MANPVFGFPKAVLLDAKSAMDLHNIQMVEGYAMELLNQQ